MICSHLLTRITSMQCSSSLLRNQARLNLHLKQRQSQKAGTLLWNLPHQSRLLHIPNKQPLILSLIARKKKISLQLRHLILQTKPARPRPTRLMMLPPLQKLMKTKSNRSLLKKREIRLKKMRSPQAKRRSLSREADSISRSPLPNWTRASSRVHRKSVHRRSWRRRRLKRRGVLIWHRGGRWSKRRRLLLSWSKQTLPKRRESRGWQNRNNLRLLEIDTEKMMNYA